MPHQLTCASALAVKTEKRENCMFPQCRNSALSEFNQLLDFFNLFDSQLILTLLYDSLSLVINAFTWMDGKKMSSAVLRVVLGAWFRRKEVDSDAAVGCCTHNGPVRCLLGFLFRKVMLKH